jgi:hypothetical protein
MSKDDKTKLDGIADGAEVNVQSDWNQTTTTADDFIKNKPVAATQTTTGLMSKDDKTKLDGIADGAEVNVQSDWNQTTTTADDFIKNKPTIVTKLTAGTNISLSPTTGVGNVTVSTPLPTLPTSSGVYMLRVQVSGGTPTYSWVLYS